MRKKHAFAHRLCPALLTATLLLLFLILVYRQLITIVVLRQA